MSDQAAPATAQQPPKFNPRVVYSALIGGVLFFVFMAVMSFLVWQDSVRLEADFDTIAVTTEGTIITRDWHYERSSGTGNRTRVYEVRYYFDRITTNDGVDLVYGEQEVSEGFYNSVDVNDAVPVQFMPEDPSINRVEDRDEDRTMMWVTLGLGAFAVVMIGTFFAVVRGRRKLLASAETPA